MESLKDIHNIAFAELKKKFCINHVPLKYPFPERPIRALGLLKADGEVFKSDKFSRIVFLKLKLPVYMSVCSTFYRPRIEYDLPVFICETVFTGNKRLFIVDIHRAGEGGEHNDSELFDRLVKIRNSYPSLLERTIKPKGKIQSVFSKAACQVKISASFDVEALDLFRSYMNVFFEIVENAVPLTGETLEQSKRLYESYLKTVVDHDPGVKGYKMLFGEKKGIERSMDIFFDS
jgi:hypothetical protein